MRTIFMAKGPSFKANYQGEPIALVDIYQLYAHILGIPAQPHNGTWSRVHSFLSSSCVGQSKSVVLMPMATVFIATLHFVL